MDDQYKLTTSSTYQVKQAFFCFACLTVFFYATFGANHLSFWLKIIISFISFVSGIYCFFEAFITKEKIIVNKNYLELKKWLFFSNKHQWKSIDIFSPEIETIGFKDTIYGLNYYLVKTNIKTKSQRSPNKNYTKRLSKEISIRCSLFYKGNSNAGATAIAELLNFFKEKYEYVDIFTDSIKKHEAEKKLASFTRLGLQKSKTIVDQPKSDFIFIMIICTFMMASILLIGILSS